jgi:outer membrane lipoprotein SlyB
MNFKLLFSTAALFAIALTGCSGKHVAVYDQNKSEALNVMSAALGPSTAERFLKDSEPVYKSSGTLAYAVANGAAGMAARSALGSAISTTSIGVDVASSLLSGPADSEVRHPKIIAWMPKDMASNEDEAGQKFAEIIYSAYSKAMAGYGVDVSAHKKVTHGWYDYLESDNKCEFISVLDHKPVEAAVLTVDMPRRVLESLKPQWLGEGEAWYFAHPATLSDSCLKIDQEKIWQEASSKLPEWIYFYTGTVTAKGNKAVYRKPFVYHQGKRLEFIMPQ